jgi:6-phosphogluconolactonase
MVDRRGFLGALGAASFLGCGGSEPVAEAPAGPTYDHLAYFGTYTRDGGSKGLYVSRFNAMTGDLATPELVAELENPSFLTFHPNGQFLYAVAEIDEGTVSAYSIDRATGALTLLNTQPTRGAAPCDLEVDATGRMLAVANYTTGSTIAYKVNPDGSLSEPTTFVQHEGSSVHARQKSPHAHSIDYSADNRFLFVCDLGTDKILRYRIDPAEGKIELDGSAGVPPGGGPRHFAFHPSGKFCFSNLEISSSVASFTYEPSTGEMTMVGVASTLPGDFAGNNSTAEIRVHPSGRFLYVSNRGHHSLALFDINEQTGDLTRRMNFATGGETPRCFAIAPGGRYLLAANQGTSDVRVFEIDPSNGELTATGAQVAVGMPVCVDYLAV